MTMSTHGYYRMERGWHENEVFGDEPYCRRAAWDWLISEAAWRPRPNREIGQLKHSLRFLAKAWNWSIGRVQRFLKTLTRENMIRVETDSEGTLKRMLITLCNYEHYQCCFGAEGEAEGEDGFAPAAARFQPESKQRRSPDGASPPKSPSRVRRDSGSREPRQGLAASEPATPPAAPAEAAAAAEVRAEFDAWIGHYPHRVALDEAFSAFAEARRAGAGLEAMIAGAGRYAQLLARPNAPAPMNPARWLRRRRWQDAPFLPAITVIEGGQSDGQSSGAGQPRRKSPHQALFDAALAVAAARKRQIALSGGPRCILGSLPPVEPAAAR